MPKTVFYCVVSWSTCKKAKDWLIKEGIKHSYYDFLKVPIDEKSLNDIAEKADLPSVGLINTRSQVFKKLGLDINGMSEAEAIALMVEYPRIIVRPILISNNKVLFRFVEKEYREHLLS